MKRIPQNKSDSVGASRFTSDASRATRIIGIDPGSQITGYGIIEMEGNRAIHVTHGVIRPGMSDPADRLHAIYRELTEVMGDYMPEESAIEQVFVHRNAASALKLGQARGAALVACAERGLEVFEYTANQVKQATVGKGHAAKQQVQHMVKVLLCLDREPQTDAADALAVALCHGHSRSGLMHMTGVKGIRRGRLR